MFNELPKTYAPKPLKPIVRLSDEIEQLQVRYLGHLIREGAYEPTRQATFKGSRATPNLHSKKRVGRPRKNWIVQTMRRTWRTLRKKLPDPTLQNKRFRKRSKTIQHWLYTAAELRLL